MQIHVVELQPNANAPGQWDMCNPQCVGSGSFPEILLPVGTGGGTVVFNIDPAKTDVTFASKVADAIWIKPGSKPKSAGIAPAGQVGTPILINGNHTLIVNDQNSGQGLNLHYRLAFSDGTSIDPVIRNGGGGGRMDLAAYALIGAVAGAILSVLFVRVVMNWRRAG
jgi:hypothetical protein